MCQSHEAAALVLPVGEDNEPAGDVEPEGLAEYGADAELPEALLGAAAAYSGVGAMSRDPDPALLETLAGLHRLLAGRHLATVQEWLRVLVKVPTIFMHAAGRSPGLPPPPAAYWDGRLSCSFQAMVVHRCRGHAGFFGMHSASEAHLPQNGVVADGVMG